MALSFDPSELKQRVSIQTRSEASDGHDGIVETWATIRVRVPARVRQLAGRHLERASQIDARAAWEVLLRYSATMPETLDGGRVRFIFHDGRAGDRTLEIVEPPREEPYRQALTMVCRERVQ